MMESLFIKCATLKKKFLFKREIPAMVISCKVCKNSKNRFFSKHLSMTASAKTPYLLQILRNAEQEILLLESTLRRG